MPHFVAFLMLPGIAFSNSSMTSSLFNYGAKRLVLAAIDSRGKIFELLFKFKLTRTLTIFGAYGILALVKYTIMTKPIKSLELHYPMIQFLINIYIYTTRCSGNLVEVSGRKYRMRDLKSTKKS